MSSSDHPDQATHGTALADQKSHSAALVPVITAVHRPPVRDRQPSRADFVTQLIATAEHVPQTRSMRRATPADASAAYGASGRLGPAQISGRRTRQTI
jgi:hypothetical protein